uniref:Uncharacterized protein n=1 Tax=Schistosoma japonicum TaxID=6182 RepID=Q5BW27_SCHJA|nr:unknown [Schistosoma japonicum]
MNVLVTNLVPPTVYRPAPSKLSGVDIGPGTFSNSLMTQWTSHFIELDAANIP